MRAICNDGLAIECRSYKAIETGVVLCADEDREEVVGFVPHDELKYVLPDGLASEVEAAMEETEVAVAVAVAGADGGDPTRTDADGRMEFSSELFGVPWFSASTDLD